ncbi:hypothetical protein [Chitinophaga sp. 212800010-3]|uniref:hypothetical protein n=1 Tax=unclassified Chitinophaga TaxID=2619133 RepID=UPI002DF60EEF|nr:hypothetical protein [Chitinophaga sp. 212800010-3]
MTESVAGKVDFSVYHLSTEVLRERGDYGLDPDEILKQDRGALFILRSSTTAYNLMDAGNWLWGNANNRLGNSASKALQLATTFNSDDSDADKRAIIYGWYYQAGFRTSVITNK